MTQTKRPFDVLSRNIGKNVTVRLKGAQVFTGTFLGYDPHWNISLDEAEQCRNHRRTAFGKLILRGNNVLYVSELDKD
ncbi:MAG: LSM domain-containing protein [Halobacteriota archaeon]|jgi:small nuclear ribonucleoprotein (snRNP)-like protein